MFSADDNKPYILEYNCRMGDPETQNILMYLDNNNVDFLDLIGFNNADYPDNFNLSFVDHKDISGFCCTIVLAAKGYPINPTKDFYLDTSKVEDANDVKVFHAGTKISNGAIKVTGGRILTINAFSNTKQGAIDLAYENILKIKAFSDAELKNEASDLVFYRNDIGS